MATSPSSGEQTFPTSISSAEDFHVKTSVRQESGLGSRDLAQAFGLNSAVSLGSFDLDTCSLRTSQGCLFTTDYDELSESFPDTGMWEFGEVYELQSSALVTCEREFSSLPSAEIVLSDGSICLIDQRDLPFLARWKWKRHSRGYAYRTIRNGKSWKNLFMHRLICPPKEGEETDHKNRNKLDNRKQNLRSVPHWVNSHNRQMRTNSLTGVRGVVKPIGRNKYQARFYENGKVKILGNFPTLEMAQQAYEQASAQALTYWPTVRTTDTTSGRGAIQVGGTFYRLNQAFHEGRSEETYRANLSDVSEIWPTATSSVDSGSAAYSTESGRHPGTTLTDAIRTWATPNAHDGRRPGSDATSTQGANLKRDAEVWQTPGTDSFRSRGGDRADEMGLDQQARTLQTWATPNCGDGSKTSIASHQGRCLVRDAERDFQLSHQDHPTQDGPVSSPPDRTSRRLSPRFVEWLMGFPLGHTEIP